MCRGVLERVPREDWGKVTVGALPLLFLPPARPRASGLGVPGAACDGGTGPVGARLGRALGNHRCSCLLPAVTASDCYVTLWLPTACSHRLQTRTVKNSRNPIWNQSFRFRIHRQLKVGPSALTDPVRCHRPAQPLTPRPTLLPLPPLPPAAPHSVPLPEPRATASLRPGPSDR